MLLDEGDELETAEGRGRQLTPDSQRPRLVGLGSVLGHIQDMTI
jgi:hypothetical protein